MKLGIGTAQFGFHYGINNKVGKPNLNKIKDILASAQNCGIDLVDTAADYGDSEENIGKTASDCFKIVTKTSKGCNARESILNSLAKLNRKNLYGVLIHDFEQAMANPADWDNIVALKESGIIQKIGFSLYLPHHLDFLMNLNFKFDLIQIPYNVFDQRFNREFPALKAKGIEVHVRSAFMQGLVFAEIDKLSDFFNPIKPKLEQLASISKETTKSIHNLCLNFVVANKYIDKVIVGVDSTQNLIENILTLKESLSIQEINLLKELQEENEKMILPYNWKS